MASKNNKFGKHKRNVPDVLFTTPKGVRVKLIYDKEYRAFKEYKETWLPMNLGGSDAESLKQYIDENF